MLERSAKRRRAREKKVRRRPFELSQRELAIVANWQSTQSVSPKLVCIIDDCAMSTLYERLKRQEYQALKDGHRTRIITESIKKRRDGLQLFKSNSAQAPGALAGMMTAGDISRLLADIVTAEDEAHVVDLLADSLGVLATLAPLELEHANERVQDAIRERRALNDDD